MESEVGRSNGAAPFALSVDELVAADLLSELVGFLRRYVVMSDTTW